jgi:hypothetical protein
VAAVVLGILGYCGAGLFFWATLVARGEEPDEMAFVAAASINPWMAVGRAIMITTWPV